MELLIHQKSDLRPEDRTLHFQHDRIAAPLACPTLSSAARMAW